jgi:hypothetical protein
LQYILNSVFTVAILFSPLHLYIRDEENNISLVYVLKNF